jgi:site-specific DNA recombinase
MASLATLPERGRVADVATAVHRNSKRAAIYVRVSTNSQEDGTSLETQEAAGRRHAAGRGYVVGPDGLYREVHTGTELWERPQLTALRDLIRRREIEVVVVYAIDRLARDPVHLGVVLTEAEHAGVAVEFVTEPLDDSPEGQLIRFVRGYAAKVEHEKIKERSMRARQARADAGKILGGPRALYGYRFNADKTGYEVDPTTAPVVRRIFAECHAGRPTRRIALGLMADGVPAPGGGPVWQPTTVRNILVHPSYAGRAANFRYRKEKLAGKAVMRLRPDADHRPLPAGKVPELVPGEWLDGIAARLTLNRQRAARNNGNPESALLRAGYVRCGYCGCAMTVHRKGGGRPDVYTCGRSNTVPGTCSGHAIAVPLLDAAVWARVVQVLTNPETIARELERTVDDDPTPVDLAAVDRSLSAADRQMRTLVEQLSHVEPGGPVAALVLEKLAQLERQQKALRAEHDAVIARRQARQSARDKLAQLEQWCRTVAVNIGGMTYAQKRLALDALAAGVRVWRVDHRRRYEIVLSIPFEESEAGIVCRSGRGSTWCGTRRS